MGIGEVVALAGTAIAVFGSIGATVRWSAVQFKAQGKELKKLDAEYDALYRQHTQFLVQFERARLAFDMVAGELEHRDPGNEMLKRARLLLMPVFHVGHVELAEYQVPYDAKAA